MVFGANTVVLGANPSGIRAYTVVFEANTVVFGGKCRGIWANTVAFRKFG